MNQMRHKAHSIIDHDSRRFVQYVSAPCDGVEFRFDTGVEGA